MASDCRAAASSASFSGFSASSCSVWPDLRVNDAGGTRFVLGLLALQGACLAWAVGSSYSKRHPHGDSVIGATAVQMLFGGLIMLVAGTLIGEWGQVSLHGRGVAALAYLTVVGSIGGFVSYIFALKYLPVSTVSIYAYINPLIAVILGAVVLGEPFGLRTVVSMAIVFAGVALVKQPSIKVSRVGATRVAEPA
jgi:drug/metabolite transporter (DMT)-like permease